MSLKQEISLYVDGHGMVAPHAVAPGEMQASDNGPMFTSEYIIMLKRQGDMRPGDLSYFRNTILRSSTHVMAFGKPRGLVLNRAPGDPSQDSIDDYLGVMAGCKELSITTLPRAYLLALIANFGFLSNTGVKTREAFLARFPQLIAAMIAAAYPGRSLKHRAIRLLAFPLFAYAALSVLFAALTAPNNQADPWRLSWLLIQATAPSSLMVRLAAMLWRSRLKRYFPEGMRGVAALYYRDNHPFCRFWID